MIYAKTENYELHKGTMQEVLDTFEENCIDSIVCDPPYELNFMSKGWDRSGVAFQKETWERCYKVLKPGGYLLAFGGTRTYHRICCAIEDAGFEIRDCIMWLYGSGFPKSMAIDRSIEGKLTIGSGNTKDFKRLNGELVDKTVLGFVKNQFEQGIRPANYNENGQQVLGKLEPTTELAKQYKGWGTCLKPAYEPVIVARKPFKGSLVDNVIEYGVGGLNIDECRVGNDTISIHNAPVGTFAGGEYNRGSDTESYRDSIGRFPSNIITDGSDEVAEGMPYTNSSGGVTTMPCIAESKEHKLSFGQNEKPLSRLETGYVAPTDSGSAMRYFYCAKASKKDRDEGLDEFEESKCSMLASNDNIDADGNFTDMLAGRDTTHKNTHPTVKPCELMQYLVRLVSPKGSKVLDCFMGSGSTGKACMYENNERNANYYFIGIEMTEEYLPIATARIEYARNNKDNQITMFDVGLEDTKKYKGETTEQGSIFDLI